MCSDGSEMNTAFESMCMPSRVLFEMPTQYHLMQDLMDGSAELSQLRSLGAAEFPAGEIE